LFRLFPSLQELQFQLEKLIDWSFELARGMTYYILSPSEGLRLMFWKLQGAGRTQASSSSGTKADTPGD
jgi:hypothetical protein